MLEVDRGISPEVIEERGYFTCSVKAELQRLNFKPSQYTFVSADEPALVIPIHRVDDGQVALYSMRPDHPRSDQKTGKPRKYEWPAEKSMRLDVPPRCLDRLKDPKVALYVTEGSGKVDALASRGLCAMDVFGTWTWLGKDPETGGKAVLPDWREIPLNDREVIIVFDSDVQKKAEVWRAHHDFAEWLKFKDARVSYIYLAAMPDGSKQGADDFFGAGHTLQELFALRTEERCAPPPNGKPPRDSTYFVNEHGTFWRRPNNAGGFDDVPIANWSARVIAHIVEDDGLETKISWEVRATLASGEQRTVCIHDPIRQFDSLTWHHELGGDARIMAGAGLRDHLRDAIQAFSTDIEDRRVFTHTGWQQIDRRVEEMQEDGITEIVEERREWVFLHAGGAIGKQGPVAGIEVELPPTLNRFELPDPPQGEELCEAVRAFLRLDVAPDRIGIPLRGATMRAPVGAANLTVELLGPSGARKTALVAVDQQAFGPAMGGIPPALPANWSSTANSLEILAFASKDVVLDIDDFAPSSNPAEAQRLHSTAGRIIRNQANQQARARLTSELRLRAEKPSRALIVMTGEEAPRDLSIRARMLLLSVGPDDVDRANLTRAQEEADAGVYARAIAGYIRWIAERGPDALLRQTTEAVKRLRRRERPGHPRTSEVAAQLIAGWTIFLQFCEEACAITAAERQGLRERCERALDEAIEEHAVATAAVDPVTRFFELLLSAITAGECHVADEGGGEPLEATAWGWYLLAGGVFPNGRRAGWRSRDRMHLYLDMGVAYREAVRMLPPGESLTVSSDTLVKRIAQKGLLTGRRDEHHLKVRKVLEGHRREVLQVRADVFSVLLDA